MNRQAVVYIDLFILICYIVILLEIANMGAYIPKNSNFCVSESFGVPLRNSLLQKGLEISICKLWLTTCFFLGLCYMVHTAILR